MIESFHRIHNFLMMGGGNGQKTMMARQKHMEKQKSTKGSQLEANKKAMNIQVLPNRVQYLVFFVLFPLATLGTYTETEKPCKVCMQTFMCTMAEAKCKEHAENKHPKSDLYTCFPHLKK